MPTRSTLAFLAANAGGIIAFPLSASRFWIEPEVADVPGANVENAFGWIVFAAPILILFVLGNLVWIIKQMPVAGLTHRLHYAALSLAVLPAWSAAYLFDNVHHGV